MRACHDTIVKLLSAGLLVLLLVETTIGEAAKTTIGRTTQGSEQSVRFVVAGDSRGSSSGINEVILAEVVQATLDEGVNFILIPGDLVMGSSNPSVLEAELLQWRSVVQPLYDAGIGVYPCRGNHDAGSKAVWDGVFSGPYALPANGPAGEENVTFSFTYGNVFVAGLDQYVVLRRINQTWLDQQLAVNEQPHIFTFGHEPAFKLRHSDCLDDFPASRDSFWTSLADVSSRVYFCGHDHFYDHARLDDGDGILYNDVHQMIVGTAGAPLRSDGAYNGNNGSWTPIRIYHEMQYGYVLVEVNSRWVTLTWKHRTGPGVYEPGGDVWTYGVGGDGCCVGTRGNIDYDSADAVNIIDVATLVRYLLAEGHPPQCEEEANVNGDEWVNIDDVTYLVAYLFQGGPEPLPCPVSE